ncbi:MAG: RNA-binding protein [marine bacterium B5-7]|nr:MAG: RNA-binding protein [marine bacterium B5-7]
MNKLPGKSLSYLRGLAHHQKVVVSVGTKGITKALVDELDIALKTHELVKVKLAGNDKSDRAMCLERLCAATDAHAVQLIGHTGVIYRPAEEPVIKLPV